MAHTYTNVILFYMNTITFFFPWRIYINTYICIWNFLASYFKYFEYTPTMIAKGFWVLHLVEGANEVPIVPEMDLELEIREENLATKMGQI
jgi:hypothetical protein